MSTVLYFYNGGLGVLNVLDARSPYGFRTYGTGSSQDWLARFVVAEDANPVCPFEVPALCDGVDFGVEVDFVSFPHSLSQLCLVGVGFDITVYSNTENSITLVVDNSGELLLHIHLALPDNVISMILPSLTLNTL
jgi:hypothetical protein